MNLGRADDPQLLAIDLDEGPDAVGENLGILADFLDQLLNNILRVFVQLETKGEGSGVSSQDGHGPILHR